MGMINLSMIIDQSFFTHQSHAALRPAAKIFWGQGAGLWGSFCTYAVPYGTWVGYMGTGTRAWARYSIATWVLVQVTTGTACHGMWMCTPRALNTSHMTGIWTPHSDAVFIPIDTAHIIAGGHRTAATRNTLERKRHGNERPCMRTRIPRFRRAAAAARHEPARCRRSHRCCSTRRAAALSAATRQGPRPTEAARGTQARAHAHSIGCAGPGARLESREMFLERAGIRSPPSAAELLHRRREERLLCAAASEWPICHRHHSSKWGLLEVVHLPAGRMQLVKCSS